MVWHGSSYLLRRTGTVWLCKIIFIWSSTQVVIVVLLSLFNVFFSLKCVFTARKGGEEKKARKKKAKPLSSWTRIKLLERTFTEGEGAVQSLCWTIWRAVISSLCCSGSQGWNGWLRHCTAFKRSVFIKTELLHFRSFVCLYLRNYWLK